MSHIKSTIKSFDLFALMQKLSFDQTKNNYATKFIPSRSLGFPTSDVEAVIAKHSEQQIVSNILSLWGMRLPIRGNKSAAEIKVFNDLHTLLNNIVVSIFSPYLYLIWCKNRSFVQKTNEMALLQKMSALLSNRITNHDIRGLRFIDGFFRSNSCRYCLYQILHCLIKAKSIRIDQFVLFWRTVNLQQRSKGFMKLADDAFLGDRVLDVESLIDVHITMYTTTSAREILPNTRKGLYLQSLLQSLLEPTCGYKLYIDSDESQGMLPLGSKSIILGQFISVGLNNQKMRKVPYIFSRIR